LQVIFGILLFILAVGGFGLLAMAEKEGCLSGRLYSTAQKWCMKRLEEPTGFQWITFLKWKNPGVYDC